MLAFSPRYVLSVMLHCKISIHSNHFYPFDFQPFLFKSRNNLPYEPPFNAIRLDQNQSFLNHERTKRQNIIKNQPLLFLTLSNSLVHLTVWGFLLSFSMFFSHFEEQK